MSMSVYKKGKSIKVENTYKPNREFLERLICQSEFNDIGILVSTVDLFGFGYETMVFNKKGEDIIANENFDVYRCDTKEQAIQNNDLAIKDVENYFKKHLGSNNVQEI